MLRLFWSGAMVRFRVYIEIVKAFFANPALNALIARCWRSGIILSCLQ